LASASFLPPSSPRFPLVTFPLTLPTSFPIETPSLTPDRSATPWSFSCVPPPRHLPPSSSSFIFKKASLSFFPYGHRKPRGFSRHPPRLPRCIREFLPSFLLSCPECLTFVPPYFLPFSFPISFQKMSVSPQPTVPNRVSVDSFLFPLEYLRRSPPYPHLHVLFFPLWPELRVFPPLSRAGQPLHFVL